MTAETARAASAGRSARFGRRIPLHLVVIFLMVIWLIRQPVEASHAH